MQDDNLIPLFVDLDGTYSKADLLFESFVDACKRNPLVLIYCCFWLARGIAYLKFRLAAAAQVNVELLPLNPEFLRFLHAEKAKGRVIYLATAASEQYAEQIIAHSNIFHGYLASDQQLNLTADAKLRKIQQISPDFAYAGNDVVDFVLFAHAKHSYLVNPSRKVRLALNRQSVDACNFSQTFDITSSRSAHKLWLQQLRIHQWLKNLLLFVPLLVSGLFTDVSKMPLLFIAFIAFGAMASATYIINDLVDLQSDRCHRVKCHRPLAAGLISIHSALLVCLILIVFAVALATLVNSEFVQLLLIYLGITLIYSLAIKRFVAIDVLTLAALYTLRIVAGAAAISVIVSGWLLAFSVSIFLSLALVKRCAEVQNLQSGDAQQLIGRGYRLTHYKLLSFFGIIAATLAVLMLGFYVEHNIASRQYPHAQLLWLLLPLLSYWLMFVWRATKRGDMHDDPLVFAMQNKVSLGIISICVATTVLAQLG